MKGNTKQFPKWFTRYYYLGSPEGVPKVVIKRYDPRRKTLRKKVVPKPGFVKVHGSTP
jgi:hypothetical protein